MNNNCNTLKEVSLVKFGFSEFKNEHCLFMRFHFKREIVEIKTFIEYDANFYINKQLGINLWLYGGMLYMAESYTDNEVFPYLKDALSFEKESIYKKLEKNKLRLLVNGFHYEKLKTLLEIDV